MFTRVDAEVVVRLWVHFFYIDLPICELENVSFEILHTFIYVSGIKKTIFQHFLKLLPFLH